MNYDLFSNRPEMKASPVILLFFLFLPVLSPSQVLSPSIKAFTPADYGGHNQVFCGARDSLGGMWFGCNEYIYHYNGNSWEEIEIMPQMSVMAMDIDEKGRIWVGGQGSFGYLRINTPGKNTPTPPVPIDSNYSGADRNITGDMSYISLTNSLPDSLNDFNTVWNVHSIGDRVLFNAFNVLFVLDSSGLRYYFPRNLQFYRSHRVGDEIWIQDYREGFWKISADSELPPSGKLPSEYKIHEDDGLGDLQIRWIIGDWKGKKDEDKVLIATAYDGLFTFDRDPKEHDRLQPIGDEWREYLGDSEIYSACSLPYSNDPSTLSNPWNASIVLNTQVNGTILIDENGKPLKTLNRDDGISADFIWRSVNGAPGSGMIWSTTNNGITQWMPGDPKTYAWEGEAFSGGVKAITKYKGRLMVTTSQGVHIKTPLNGNKDGWYKIEGSEGFCHEVEVIGEGTRQKEVMVAVGTNGIYSLIEEEQKDWKITDLTPHQIHTIKTIKAPGKGYYMVAGGRKGLFFYWKRVAGSGDWKELLHIQDVTQDIMSLETEVNDNKDTTEKNLRIWVSYSTKGGFRVDIPMDSLKVLQDDQKQFYEVSLKTLEKEKGPKGLQYWNVDQSNLPEGYLKFHKINGQIKATTDSGVYRPVPLDGTKEKVRLTPDNFLGPKFTPKPNIPGGSGTHAYFIKKFSDNKYIVTSDRGIFEVSSNNGEFTVDSIPYKGMEVNSVEPIYVDSNGVIWMGGTNGLVRYDTRVKKDFFRKYPCSIRKVKVSFPKQKKNTDNDSTLFAGFFAKPAPGSDLLDWRRVYEQPKEFVPTLPFSMNGIRFHYVAPYYDQQDKVTYSYKLKGFNRKWSDWTNETMKEYTSLPEGRYTFKVKAKNAYGIESTISEYRFEILPPWYRTMTAFFGYSVGAIALIWLLIRINSQRLIAQKRKLEKEVQDRTKKIKEQQEETEKRKQEVEKAHAELSEAHKSITESIDYAKKIQQALLESEEHVSTNVPNHFVLFKPQSQVSGDFFWTNQHKGYLYVAAVDCTGHGVPGAFMSMLGVSFLNEIMNTNEIPTPGDVLTRLKNRVVKELSGADNEEGTKDGMDASIIRIPLNEKDRNSIEVQYAGAQNSLYVIRNNIGGNPPEYEVTQDDEPIERDVLKTFDKHPHCIEIRGDRQPVGYDEFGQGSFTTITMKLQKDDMLYLFSDGYADQFGGPNGKKFRYGPFKELLTRIHKDHVNEQKKELERAFEEWKEQSNQEQIDDVLVIGLRL